MIVSLWPVDDDGFRNVCMWPAVLQSTLAAALLVLATSFVMSRHTGRRRGIFGSAGNSRVPVEYPKSGRVKLVDNRAQTGALVLLLCVLQTALASAWLLDVADKQKDQGHSYGHKHDGSYQFALSFLGVSVFVLVMSAVLYVRYLRCNRLLYSGLFTWLPFAAVAVQCAVCLCEVYFSFFTADHISEPIFGRDASSRSNYLVLLSLATALLFAAQSVVQRRPYFVRPQDSVLEGSNGDAASAFVDRCTSEGGRFGGSGDSTPLAPRHSVMQSDLVRSSESSSSRLSRLFFCWPGEIIGKGAKRQLEFHDLYRLDNKDMPEDAWRRYKKHRKPGRSLLVALLFTLAPELLAQSMFAIAESFLYFSGPFFLQRILRFIEARKDGSSSDGPPGLRAAYLDALGLFAFTVLTSLMAQQCLWIGCHISMRIKGLLVSELSLKTLQRSSAGTQSGANAANDDGSDDADDDDDSTGDALHSASNGKIMNLLTADFERITEVASHLDHLYALPVMLAVGIWYMYALLGISAIVGLLVAVMYVPISKALLQYLSTVETELNLQSDQRVAAITELLQGIKTVKLFGWESGFVRRINEKRESQLAYLWKCFMAWTGIAIGSMLAPMLILVVIFAVYAVGLGQQLTAETAFTAISVFQLIRIVFQQLPGTLNWVVGGYVSFKRIDQYLQQPQLQSPDTRVVKQGRQDSQNAAFGFVDADLEWVDSRDVGANASYAPVAAIGVSAEQTPLLAEMPAGGTQSLSQAPSLLYSANGSDAPFALKNIDIRFPLGGMSLVAGPTGSGKSSLLAALIGEMTLTRGHILPPPMPLLQRLSISASFDQLADLGADTACFAYVAQEAWVRNATIRDNILFDEPYEQARYEETLRVCLLKPDLRMLTAGDMTEIGERGVTLSGGQKQRVALARAVYSSRPVLLIDDCLSAVDAHTAKHILTECLAGNNTWLMQGRTRVLVTHHVSLCLAYAQHIAMMHEGRVVAQGHPQELLATGALADAMEQQTDKGSSNASSNSSSISLGPHMVAGHAASSPAAAVQDPRTEDVHNSERKSKIALQQSLDPATDLSALQGMLVKDEEREEGHVKLDTWRVYLDSCGGTRFWVISLAMLVACQALEVLQGYWVRIWVDSSKNSGSGHSAAFWLGIYMAIGMGNAACLFVQVLFICRGSIRASRNIHKALLQKVVHATPRFFDSTPLGRIISRFSRDMQIVDDELRNDSIWFVFNVLAVVSVIAVIATVLPAFLLVAALVSMAYAGIAYHYLKTSRQLKRLESNSMSPLLSLFGELIQGTSTIRAFGSVQLYIREAMNRISAHNQPLYMVWASNRWLSIRMDIAGAAVSSACALSILANLDWIDAGLAGFLLSYSLTFSESVVWAIRNYSSAELDMNAIERVSQYLRIEQEAALHVDEPCGIPPPGWPALGNIDIEDLVVEYVPGTRVLQGISLSAQHGEKIGVVGRTGAGKSTLTLALLRFVEPSGGRVVLDGVDISKIGLEQLRRSITIIPQDPTLFNGTVRYNLDPFGEYDDEHLWNAVRKSYLARESESEADSGSSSIKAASSDGAVERARLANGIFSSLDAEIRDSGQNLSLGQRQLVALARALVRQSRLIIMDEATASVDFATDSCIQRTIRGPEFAGSTLFCIAHRLRTVIDYDRVLVLDKGRVVEFDTPKRLLQKPQGVFRGMCEQSGEYGHFVDQLGAV
ncbi:hypothetical protein LPJ56_000854 [Coemansia sp. RSA 2599]|nr:hypothetical protein LPJ75_000292 [Coemansia sp. RSA 2598]KAJ1828823.1 hypothetical protein LPJ56_000854 [Coemansia sp. RSA 2599]